MVLFKKSPFAPAFLDDLKSRLEEEKPQPRRLFQPVYVRALPVIAALLLLWHFAQDANRPWVEHADFNGAVWSQAGHNLLATEIKESLGIPAPFYYGSPPIPVEEYYTHHPALLAWTVAGTFKLLGEHEWVARLVPIGCSMISLALLWLLARSCLGEIAAGFAAMIFALLPMELVYGEMVNFEPCTLMWMLCGFLGLRWWHLTSKKRWQALMLAGFTLSMLTAWMGYILVLMVCGYLLVFQRRSYGKTAYVLLGIAVASASLFLVQIGIFSANSFKDLSQAFMLRAGQSYATQPFTISAWAGKVGISLMHHFPLPFLMIAAIGVIGTFLEKSNAEKFGAGWICGCFFAANAFYDVAFRNASFIHDYASFYFIVPVAIMAGKGILLLAEWGCGHRHAISMAPAGVATLFLCGLGIAGYQSAQGLQPQAQVLGWSRREPAGLIPALGGLIKREFPDAKVLTNFDVPFSPQLCYYAQTMPVNGLLESEDWKEYIADQDEKLGGVICIEDENSAEILELLDPKTLHYVRVEGIPFCFWKP